MTDYAVRGNQNKEQDRTELKEPEGSGSAGASPSCEWVHMNEVLTARCQHVYGSDLSPILKYDAITGDTLHSLYFFFSLAQTVPKPRELFPITGLTWNLSTVSR